MLLKYQEGNTTIHVTDCIEENNARTRGFTAPSVNTRSMAIQNIILVLSVVLYIEENKKAENAEPRGEDGGGGAGVIPNLLIIAPSFFVSSFLACIQS